MHDVLHALGPQAAHVVDLWRLTLAITGIVFAALLVVLALALLRAPRARAGAVEVDEGPAARRRHTRVVGGAMALAVVLLFVLIGASVATDRALAAIALRDALHIEVVGHQWWWELRYDDPDPSRVFATANEMHVPVGRPVVLTLKADDVIHSLWLPSLGGKKDLIPGRETLHVLRVDRPSEHRGPCAEFCGVQHANMTLTLIAEPTERYEAWADAQRQWAPKVEGAQVARGRELFVQGPCALCHAISGTSASAQTAPDLTHLASRARIAAGVLPNTPDALAAWIRDPQAHKPGANMPAYALPADDLAALVAFLGTLR